MQGWPDDAGRVGMAVVTWSHTMTPARTAVKGAVSVTFDELITTPRISIAHLALDPATKQRFGAARSDAMRYDAIFVNTSRAGLAVITRIDESRTFGPTPHNKPISFLTKAPLHLGWIVK